MPPRSRSNFAAKTATDTSQRLHRRSFAQSSPPPNERTPLLDGGQDEHIQEEEHGVEWLRSWFCNTFHLSSSKSKSTSQDGRRRATSDVYKPRPGAFPRPVGGTDKLGTFAGVFVPVTLNVLSILMFLRFGFILGQTGVVGMMGKIIQSQHRQGSSLSLLRLHEPVASIPLWNVKVLCGGDEIQHKSSAGSDENAIWQAALFALSQTDDDRHACGWLCDQSSHHNVHLRHRD